MVTRTQKRTIDDLFRQEGDVNAERDENSDDRLHSENRAKRIKLSIPKILDCNFFIIISNENAKVEAKCMECSKIKKGHLTTTGKNPAILSNLSDYLRSKPNDPVNTTINKRQQNIDSFISHPEKVVFLFSFRPKDFVLIPSLFLLSNSYQRI